MVPSYSLGSLLVIQLESGWELEEDRLAVTGGDQTMVWGSSPLLCVLVWGSCQHGITVSEPLA